MQYTNYNARYRIITRNLAELSSRILVRYDGSEYSNKAVRQTIEYAKSLSKDVEIILIYVFQEIHLPPSYDYGMRISYVKSSKEYLKESLSTNEDALLVGMLNRRRMEFKDGGMNNVKNVSIYWKSDTE